MMEITITLLSDLCSGNGESYGNRIDTDIWTDSFGLPQIPGRRLKGCLRESADFLADQGYVLPESKVPLTAELVNELFGTASRAGAFHVGDAVLPESGDMRNFLSEAKDKGLSSPLRVTELYTRILGQTSLENGVAKENTLRYTRILNRWDPLKEQKPLVFRAKAEVAEDRPELCEALAACCQATRHIGTHRNRGLGNVKMALEKTEAEGKKATVDIKKHTNPDEAVTLEYRFAFDAAIDMPRGAIPARSVIGAMAEVRLKDYPADEVFADLFLNGTVCWTDLTPVIDGQYSRPMPFAMAYFRDLKETRNLYNITEKEIPLKRKSINGAFITEKGDHYARISAETVYHHRHEHAGRASRDEALLYQKTVMPEGMVFAGRVTFPAGMLETVQALISRANIRIGHSRNAQYATCRLLSIREIEVKPEKVTIPAGEPVYVQLLSDLVVSDQGIYTVDDRIVRQKIAGAFGLEDDEARRDYCAYRIVGGYQAVWGLWKPQMTMACAGSIYRFISKGEDMERYGVIGEFPQEDLGRVRVFAEGELPDRPRECHVDEAWALNGGSTEDFFCALLVSRAADVIMDNAERLYQENRKAWSNQKYNGLMSRIRQSLKDSDTPEKLSYLIADIKDTEKKPFAQNLFRTIYGDGKEESVVSLMLQGQDELLSDIMSHSGAKKKVFAQWKAPLTHILHAAYFEKGKEG